MSDDLKPCPFCGGQPYTRTRQDEDLSTHNTVDWHFVGCHNCEVSFEIPDGYDCGTASEQWNTRADLAPRWFRMDDPENPPPKDGTRVLVSGLDFGKGPNRHTHICAYSKRMWRPVYPCADRFCAEMARGWHSDGKGDYGPGLVFLTHWMPLPEPPK